VPTEAQWNGVRANNTQTNVGTFSDNATNYSAGKKFGDNLMLPAAGARRGIDGTLYSRGSYGYYWSSTEYSTSYALYLTFYSASASTLNGISFVGNHHTRSFGCSVRCIAE
jgi:uncharacterized protein (TIGR02145 family)